MLDGLFNVLEQFNVEHEANYYETSAAFTRFAMYGYYRLFQETVLYELNVIGAKTVSVVVTSETINDIVFLLEHSLKEKEHIHTNIEKSPSRADIVIHNRILSVPYIRDYIVLILVAWLHAKIVNFDSNSVLRFQESNDILSFVSNC